MFKWLAWLGRFIGSNAIKRKKVAYWCYLYTLFAWNVGNSIVFLSRHSSFVLDIVGSKLSAEFVAILRYHAENKEKSSPNSHFDTVSRAQHNKKTAAVSISSFIMEKIINFYWDLISELELFRAAARSVDSSKNCAFFSQSLQMTVSSNWYWELIKRANFQVQNDEVQRGTRAICKFISRKLIRMKNQQKHNFEMPSAFDSMDAKKTVPIPKGKWKSIHSLSTMNEHSLRVKKWWKASSNKWIREFNALHANGWHVWCTRLSIAEKEPAY